MAPRCCFCGGKSHLHKVTDVLRSFLNIPIVGTRAFVCEGHFDYGTFTGQFTKGQKKKRHTLDKSKLARPPGSLALASPIGASASHTSATSTSSATPFSVSPSKSMSTSDAPALCAYHRHDSADSDPTDSLRGTHSTSPVGQFPTSSNSDAINPTAQSPGILNAAPLGDFSAPTSTVRQTTLLSCVSAVSLNPNPGASLTDQVSADSELFTSLVPPIQWSSHDVPRLADETIEHHEVREDENSNNAPSSNILPISLTVVNSILPFGFSLALSVPTLIAPELPTNFSFIVSCTRSGNSVEIADSRLILPLPMSGSPEVNSSRDISISSLSNSSAVRNSLVKIPLSNSTLHCQTFVTPNHSQNSCAPSFSIPNTRKTSSRKSRRKWNPGTIKRALEIRFATGSLAYENLRKRGFPLPSRSTISEYTGHFCFTPGIDPHVFKELSSSLSSFALLDRDICLIFDETSLKPNVSFDENLKMNLGKTSMPESSNEANKV